MPGRALATMSSVTVAARAGSSSPSRDSESTATPSATSSAATPSPMPMRAERRASRTANRAARASRRRRAGDSGAEPSASASSAASGSSSGAIGSSSATRCADTHFVAAGNHLRRRSRLRRAVALGSFIGAGRSLDSAVRRVQRAEELGYESVYVTHIASRDSITLLTIYAANTERVRLGTGVIPIYARTPCEHGAVVRDARRVLGRAHGGRPRASRTSRSWRAGTASRSTSRWPRCASTWRSCGRSSAARTRPRARSSAPASTSWATSRCGRTCRSTSPASPPACCASRARSPTA